MSTLFDRRRALVVLLVTTSLAGLLVACGDDDDDVVVGVGAASLPIAPNQDLIVSAIRHVAALRPRDDDGIPIVYVVRTGEHELSAGVQADVAAALRDHIDVRFADAREEALDESEPEAPVRDGGVLMLVGDLPEQSEPASLAVEIYYAANDRLRSILTLETEPAGGTAPPDSMVWQVTATSLVPLDVPT